MPEIQRDEARRGIECLGLPSVVLRIYDGEAVHPVLENRAETPYYSFTEGSNLDPTFLPFWECGVEISGYSRRLGEYQVVSLEAPDEPSFSSSTFRGLFCNLLILLWEDDQDETTLSELETLFEMPPINQLLHRLQTQPQYLAEWSDWSASVIQEYEVG